MTLMTQRHRAARLVATVLLTGMSLGTQAAVLPARPVVAVTECLGYYTLGLPGAFEYALMSNFSQSLGAWGSEIRLHLQGPETQDVSLSQPATVAELGALMSTKNAEQQREKDRFLEAAKWIDEHPAAARDMDPDGSERKAQREKASRVPLFKPVPMRDAVYFPNNDQLALHALVNGHILSTELKPQGTPEQTLDAFLSHYKPRALGEVPTGPGVCVPFGMFTGEQQPATVGLNIRLKDQPDIVVFLLARDAAKDAPENPDEFIDRKTQPMTTFYGSRGATAMDRIRPYRHVSVDGRQGVGTFVNIKRDATLLQSIHNPATGDVDWGYLAYIPGQSGGKPGDSFNLVFKVERFGRFAKRPMSESEFRDLTLRIAASIKRRPGAWVGK